MRKKILCFLMGILTLGFVSCNDDDTDSPKPELGNQIVGTYKGDMKIILGEETNGTDSKQKVYIKKASDDKVNLELKNFTFGPVNVESIKVSDIPVIQKDKKYTIKATSKMDIKIGEASVPVDLDVTGEVVEEELVLTILVTNVPVYETVNVAFEGTRMPFDVEKDGSQILKMTFNDDDKVSGQPIINGKNITFQIYDEIELGQIEKGILKMAPIIEISAGATISPTSGIKLDFGQPQTYTVTAEDGINQTVYTVSYSKGLYDFESWVIGTNEPQAPEFTYYNPINGWASSNIGVHLIKGIYSENTGLTQEERDYFTNLSYAVLPEKGGYNSSTAAKVQTVDTKGFPGAASEWFTMPAIPKVTSGSLFLGTFELDMLNTLNSTKFGVQYMSKPSKLKGFYKYTPGETYYHCPDPSIMNTHIVEADPTKKDECSVVAVLYEVNKYSESLTGMDVNNSEKVVLRAEMYSKGAADWTSFEIPFELLEGKTYDPSKKYKLAIVFSASRWGDTFSGAPGSTMFVDDVQIVVE